MTLELITTASRPKWAGVDICWLQQLLQGLDATSVPGPGGTFSIRPGLIYSDDDRARSRLPRFPKCHWQCHRCVAMPAGEGECACECVWLGSSPFYSLCLLLLLCCQSRWWLLRRVIISASGIWHLSTRPGFCSHTNGPSGLKKKRPPLVVASADVVNVSRGI